MNSQSEVRGEDSLYFYPKEYGGPRPIDQQIVATASIFGLDPSSAFAYVANSPELPLGAEGWFAVPSFHALARRYFFQADSHDEKYCFASALVLDKIKGYRPLNSTFFDRLTPHNLWISNYALRQWEIFDEKKGDILIIAAQLGLRYAGLTAAEARTKSLFSDSGNECALGLLGVGSILLNHPERLVGGQELGIICAGDQLHFNGVPNFGSAGNLVFYSSLDDEAYPNSGAASFFVP